MNDYEFWRQPDALERWHERCLAAQAEAKRTGKTAVERAIDDMQAPARKLAAQLRKNAARKYIKRPHLLDAIWPDLSLREPNAILALLNPTIPWGGNPFGALTTDVCRAGARLYARWLRRKERVSEYLEAAE